MPTRFQIRTYLSYWLDAVDEHSLHSPFFYDLYTKIIKPGGDKTQHAAIEACRKELLHTKTVIPVTDLGAGSQKIKQPARRISDIARVSLTPPDLSALYARIITYFECATIIELGTSLGINTLYLASRPAAHVTTFEGAPNIAATARNTFKTFRAANISLIEGNIDQTLPAFLANINRLDFAFIDANHRYEPTMRYFQWFAQKIHARSVVIVDDIHYSPEMQLAWHEIKHHSLVYASADLYRCGILFFDPSLNKQHVVLQR